jgi:serine/threonine-protein kinase
MPLGEGGMGAVYVAVDETLQREVAIKVMHDDLAKDPASVARFRREALAVARLSHPGVVLVYDLVEEPGRVAIVMERLQGASLRQRLAAEGALSAPEAVAVTRSILEALAAAHAVGILHRDLKPANVFVTSQGAVKLLDFGVARLVDATRLTETGELLGTVRYMAPELLRGEEPSPASDLYAVGVMAYELLAGAPPFAGAGVDLMIRVREGGAKPLAEVAPHVPAEVAKAIDRALARDPTARFASAVDMLAALPDLPRERPAVRPAEAHGESARQPPRRRWRAPVLVAGGVLLSALIGTAAALTTTAPARRRDGAMRVLVGPRELAPSASIPTITAAPPASSARVVKAAPKAPRVTMYGLGNNVPDKGHDGETYDGIHRAIAAAEGEIGGCVAASPASIQYVSAVLRPGGSTSCVAYPDAVPLPCCARALAKIPLPPGDYEYTTVYMVSR